MCTLSIKNTFFKETKWNLFTFLRSYLKRLWSWSGCLSNHNTAGLRGGFHLHLQTINPTNTVSTKTPPPHPNTHAHPPTKKKQSCFAIGSTSIIQNRFNVFADSGFSHMQCEFLSLLSKWTWVQTNQNITVSTNISFSIYLCLCLHKVSDH